MKPDRVRDLIATAWANWNRPIPPALTRADPDDIAAELDRRRARADRWHQREHDAIDTLARRIDEARGTTS